MPCHSVTDSLDMNPPVTLTEAQMDQDCAALQLSHLPVPQAKIIIAAAHPVLRVFQPTNLLMISDFHNKMHQKQKRTDHITVESTGEGF